MQNNNIDMNWLPGSSFDFVNTKCMSTTIRRMGDEFYFVRSPIQAFVYMRGTMLDPAVDFVPKGTYWNICRFAYKTVKFGPLLRKATSLMR